MQLSRFFRNPKLRPVGRPRPRARVAGAVLLIGALSAVMAQRLVTAQTAFQAGNLALLVAGASANNTTGSVVEINTTTASQTAIQTIALPDTLSADSYRMSGSATSTGYVSLSNDRTLLAFNGANSAVTASNANTLNPRGVYTVNASGAVVVKTTYTGVSGNQTRSSTTLNNTDWYIADQGGLFTNNGITASPAGNFRAAKSFGGVVYLSQASSTVTTIQVTSASAASGGTVTGLPGLTNNASIQDYYLIRSGDNGTTYDILYVLSATSNTAGSIAKYSLLDTNANTILGDAGDLWTANGTYVTTFGGFGLAAADAGAGAVLYLSTGQGALTGNSVLKVTDEAGYNAAISVTTANNVTLFTAAAGTIIKGLDFAPVSPFPAVSLSVDTNSASEAATTVVTVTATASSSVVGDQTVSLGVSGTDVTAGDYTLSASTITILSGQTTGSVTFTVVDDAAVEATETATLTIANPSSGIALGSVATQNVAITDNDVAPNPTVSLTVDANSASEAAATVVTVTATASAVVASDQTVSLGVNGTGITAGDYTLSATTITILSGQTTGSVTFTVVDDSDIEPTETATLTISDPSAGISLGAPTTQNIAIADSDTITVDLSTYVRVGRFDLPEPTRTTPPTNSLLAQEASGVTYNWDTDTLFIAADGSTSIVQVTKTGQLIDSMTLALGSSPQGTDFYDTEGLTYIGGGQFVMVEERDRQAVLFTYAAGTTLSRAGAQTVQLGTFIGNIGLEGITYDPLTSGYIAVKETAPQGIFQTGIDFPAGTATNGSPTSANSTNLFNPTLAGLLDLADVFALSNLPSMSGQVENSHLLVLSQESGKVVNISRSGVISSSLTIVTDPGNPLSVPSQQHEGLTMDHDRKLYIVSENGGGDFDHPQLWVYEPSLVPNQAPTGLALINQVNTIAENSSTANRIKVADVAITDDGLGVNNLSVTGADAAFFEVDSNGLYIKAGTSLDFEVKAAYSVNVEVDDPTLGGAPDAAATFSLSITDVDPETPGVPTIIVSEIAPWSSGNSPIAVDWFEVTNTGATPVNIAGWKVDDSSGSFASAATLNGITSIAAGESVIFMETADLAGKSAAFVSNWFGASAPAGLQIGSYSGSGLGLSTGGDAVNLYDSGGVLQANVVFGASPASAPFATFNNAGGLNNATISQLSVVGVNGAFAAVNDPNEIGSPGTIGRLFISEVAPWSSGNSPVAADWFEVTNTTAHTIALAGWKIDDSSGSFAAGGLLTGVTSIAPGESVIFLESSGSNPPATVITNFKAVWFGDETPVGLQVGTYQAGGIGLSTGGDAVNLYKPDGSGGGLLQASVSFGISPAGPSFPTFDNARALNGVAISQLSVPSVNGAFPAANDAFEIGSPGIAPLSVPPIVNTPTSSSITATTAMLGGNAASDGGSPITERGVVYAATIDNGDPLIGGSGVTQVLISGTTGVFSASVTGLSADTGYSFKAYATNAIGTTYTPVATFTTLQPSVSISDVSLVEGNGGSTNAVFTVTLSDPTARTVTVSAMTANLSATAGSDYTATGPTTLTFAPTVTSQTFSVPVLGDVIVESDEMFEVTLSSATNASIADGVGIGTITNDEATPPSRVFVSANTGNDANVCSTQTTPCLSLAGAISQSASDGEVIVLTSGEYEAAPLLIGKGIKITSPSGTVAFIRQPITVNAPGGRVVLRGLTLKGTGAASGLTLVAADSLAIEETGFDSWSVGLAFANLAPAKVVVTNSYFASNQKAIFDNGTGNQTAVADSRFDGNTIGIDASAGGFSVRQSLFTANTTGVKAGSGSVDIRHSELWGNTTALETTGGTVRIGRSHIFGNQTGLLNTSGSMVSFGTSVIRGNGTNTSGAVTTIPEQ